MISSSRPPASTGASRLRTGAPAVSSRSIASISLFIGPDGLAIGVGLLTPVAAVAGTMPVAVPLVDVAVFAVPFGEPLEAALAAVPSVGAALDAVLVACRTPWGRPAPSVGLRGQLLRHAAPRTGR